MGIWQCWLQKLGSNQALRDYLEGAGSTLVMFPPQTRYWAHPARDGWDLFVDSVMTGTDIERAKARVEQDMRRGME